MSEMEREFGWDDTIEKENEFVILPEGDYRFTVKSLDRARHNGSDKLPPCNKAVVDLEVVSDDGTVGATLKHNLFLHSKCEGLLSAFFLGIGLKKHGEPLKMDWSKVVGSKGRCKISIREWKSDKGETMQSNEIKKFYEPDTAQQAPASLVPGQF